jgi:hypothetical protein
MLPDAMGDRIQRVGVSVMPSTRDAVIYGGQLPHTLPTRTKAQMQSWLAALHLCSSSGV